MTVKPIWAIVRGNVVKYDSMLQACIEHGIKNSVMYNDTNITRARGDDSFMRDGIQFFLREPGPMEIVNTQKRGLLPGLCTMRQGVYRGQRV